MAACTREEIELAMRALSVTIIIVCVAASYRTEKYNARSHAASTLIFRTFVFALIVGKKVRCYFNAF